jgi:AraC family transcriptional activator of pobA
METFARNAYIGVAMDLQNTLLYISSFQDLDEGYLKHPARDSFYEIYWLKHNKPLHFVEDGKVKVKGDWMYLVPPFRIFPFDKTGKEGLLIAFNRELLVMEPKEYSLSLFRLFSRHGDFSTLFMDEHNSGNLHVILRLLIDEYCEEPPNVLLQRTLLKAFLLKLMSNRDQELVSPNVNEKRIYHFLLLLDHHFTTQRDVDFYASKLNLSSKRLNQILKERFNRTIGQLLKERIIIEAKHELFAGKGGVKEIAFKLGFYDASYFSRFFRKATGVSPEQYRMRFAEQININNRLSSSYEK